MEGGHPQTHGEAVDIEEMKFEKDNAVLANEACCAGKPGDKRCSAMPCVVPQTISGVFLTFLMFLVAGAMVLVLVTRTTNGGHASAVLATPNSFAVNSAVLNSGRVSAMEVTSKSSVVDSAAFDSHVIMDDNTAINEKGRWVAAMVGDAPFLHHWFGSNDAKAFHHDGGLSPTVVAAKYKSHIGTAGCYHIDEWHPSGNAAEMTMTASVTVEHAGGSTKLIANQSSLGGQWNHLATLRFEIGAAMVTLSNEGRTCVGQGACYTMYDAFRLRYTDALCSSAELSGSLFAAPGTSLTAATSSVNHRAVEAPSGSAASRCHPAIIVNDFDKDRVSAIVADGAENSAQQGREAFRPGRVGEKPYFHGWFGDIVQKDFHHDDHINKGLLRVNYTTPLVSTGCYIVEEWHLGGNQYCLNYMPRSVPFHVHHVGGVRTIYVDQSTNGGQWNPLGAFMFDGLHATVVASNSDTDNCEYVGHCYTVFDGLRFVFAGKTCSEPSVVLSDEFRKLSDQACDDAQSLSQLRRVPTSDSVEGVRSAQDSPVKLLDVRYPEAGNAFTPSGQLRLQWRTEGVPASRVVMIALWYDDLDLKTLATMENTGDAILQLPHASFLRDFAGNAIKEHGADQFRFRIDVQHEKVEFSDGWSDQLYAFSPRFTIVM